MSNKQHVAKRLFRFASAQWLTTALVGIGLITFLVSLVLQAEDSIQVAAGVEISFGGAELTRLMATNLLVWSYFALLVGHLFCRWVKALHEDRQPPDISLADKDRILAEAWRYGIILEPGDWRGLTGRELGSAWTSASTEAEIVYRRRPSKLPQRLWQLGLLVLAAGLVLSTMVRVSSTVKLGEGQVVEAGTSTEISRYDWRFPVEAKVPLELGALTLDMGGVDLGLNDRLRPRGGIILKWPISAKVVYLSRNQERTFTARAFPPTVAGGHLVTLTGVGLGPRIVAERAGEVVVDTFIPLNIVPGRSDKASMVVEGVPYTLDFGLTPQGKATLLESPFRLSLNDEQGKRGVVASATVGPLTEPLVYEEWRISIPETRPWVSLSITRDPAMLLVVGGAVMVLLGLAAWCVVLVIGHEQWAFVEILGPSAKRLYVGVDASLTARRKARRRLEALLRDLGR